MLVFILVFLAVTLGIVAVHQIMTGVGQKEPSRIRQRLSEEFHESAPPAGMLFKNLEPLPAAAPMQQLSVAEMDRLAASRQPKQNLRVRLSAILEQSAIKTRPVWLLAITILMQLVFGAAGMVLWGAAGAIAGFLAGALPVPIFVWRRYCGQREKMIAQLPEALELMSRILRSGQSIPQSLQAVAETSEQPAADEFARCFHQLNLGLSPEIAFEEMARRTPLIEMRIFLMALAIQRQTGGKLSDVLTRLAKLVRARLQLRRQVKTLTAEGRMQGKVLLVMPFILFAMLMVINRSYVEILLEHQMLLAVSGVSMLVGVFWIRRITNLEL